MERAQKDYVITPSALQQLSKDKLISLLEGGLDRYEDYSETLQNHKHEVMRNKTTFADRYQLQVLETIDCLDMAADNVDRTIKLLTAEGENVRSNVRSKIVLESLIQPIFNGTIEPWTWPQWIQIFKEFLENHDLVFTDLTLNYLKKALSDEPLKIVNMLGSSISAQAAISHLGKIYGNEENILREILRAIRKIRLPHYKRQQWQKLETQTQRLQKLLQKVPTGNLCHEIVREVEICLPLEKREELTLGLKVRSPDQHMSFISKLLKDIEDFANYSAKKFYQARYSCLNYDPDDEVHDENSDSEAEDSDASPEDQVDLEAWERELEERELEEKEWQRRAIF